MYTPESLHSLPGKETEQLLRETHAALAGLLWLIEDLRNFDEPIHESHFDDTVPVDRAQQVHRLLMTKTAKAIVERGYLAEGRVEFLDWAVRCKVDQAFKDAELLFAKPKE